MFTRSNSTIFIVFKSYLNKIPGISTVYKYHSTYSAKKYLPYSFYHLQIHHCLRSSNKNVHTAKGWKPLFRDGRKEEYDTKKKLFSCEDGTDAIPHDVLLRQLQDCNSVSDQIKRFCSSMSLTPKDMENRKEFVKFLTELFKPYFPKFKVHLFGSSINGLGFKGCDADVCIQTIFDEKGFVPKVTEPPSLDAVIKGEVSGDYVSHLPPRMLLRFVRRILRTHSSDVHKKFLLIKARWPLLRFYNSKHDLFCDFSCERVASSRNTKLMRLICHLDERIASLIKIIRYWGKHGGFVGDIDLFNSYAFSLLVVHFLQLRNPPVVPPIQELIEKSEYLNHGDIDDDDILFNDVKKFDKSKNTETVEELLREYFFHFLTFDYLRILVPLTSSVIPKEEFLPSVIKDDDDVFLFSTITVQDPFRLNFNVTEGAKDLACLHFIDGLIKACKVYQDKHLWHPTTEKWGISNLFYKSQYNDKNKKWQQSTVHTIKLPLKTDVSLVKKVLEYCLLFDCEETEVIKDGISPSSLRLSCKVYCDTWIGRNLIHAGCPPSITDKLEVENWISTQISKNKSAGKQRFTFLCECFESTCDNELNLRLTFRKPEEYVQYLTVQILVIFLKEYVPSMCKN